LTISLLPEGITYLDVFATVMSKLSNNTSRVMEGSSKSHLLLSTSKKRESLGLTFGSFKPGDRDDVVNTRSIEVKPSPLAEFEANLIYTQALLTPTNGGAKLCIEMNRNGIYPSTMEEYFQWLLDEAWTDQGKEPPFPGATVNLTADAAKTFVQELNTLTRVQKASVRFPQPNPSWYDNDGPLAEEAGESNAQWIEVVMTAARSHSLALGKGFVRTIRRLANADKPFRAKVFGERNGTPVPPIDSNNLAKHEWVSVPVDDSGKVLEQHIFAELESLRTKEE